MKKNLFFAALAAIAFASCANDDLLVDNVTTPNEETGVEIGFDTYAETQTRAENSDATNKNSLSTYHTSFDVWGYKNGVAAGNGVDVFVKVPVTYSSSAWGYTTKRYWDKSASGYDFYAAAPANDAWTFDKTSRKLSYDNYSLTGATIDASATIDNAAKFATDVDLMISTDVNNYNTYTSTAVDLNFNHILSRLNIGVKKNEDLAAEVKLTSVKVYNMKSNGKFDEGASLGTDVLANGTVKRWGAATNTATTFTSGVGYSTETTITKDVNYVYQALCIPQTIGEETVNLNGKASAAEGTEGQAGYVAAVNAVSDTSKPYLVIEYTLDGEAFKYYYNLADVFNGTTGGDVNFCEGWQNNLTITISPAEINFDAKVYEWTTKNTGTVTVPE